MAIRPGKFCPLRGFHLLVLCHCITYVITIVMLRCARMLVDRTSVHFPSVFNRDLSSFSILFLAEPACWEKGHCFYCCPLFLPYMHLARSHQLLAPPICGTLYSWSGHRAEEFHRTCVRRWMLVEFWSAAVLSQLSLHPRRTSAYPRCLGNDVVSFDWCSCATPGGTQ